MLKFCAVVFVHDMPLYHST